MAGIAQTLRLGDDLSQTAGAVVPKLEKRGLYKKARTGMSPREGEYVVKLLVSRNGSETLVTLSNGVAHRVLNIAHGRDSGEQFDHISTNVAPPQEGLESDFFYTSDVQEIASKEGVVLFRLSTHQISN